MNVEMFEKVITFLQEEPRRFDMKEGLRSISLPGVFTPESESRTIGEYERDKDEMPPCGTTCCIAGAAAIVSGKLKPTLVTDTYKLYDVGWWNTYETACEALDITTGQARRLFYMKDMHYSAEGWPEEFVAAYKAARNSQERSAVGVSRIRHFLATDGRE